ncbi:hypothetical protein Pcinc_019979 [Petrolisthes cinctipes]|uniref:RRP12-like protein n=1 Tax=Petrolisthes cinctipes TaxID=88211 RepID=A0AAE1KKE5_PETCI|nr:hypothetical protein Pcinc_019979 [Petrolisthes cinctipes]
MVAGSSVVALGGSEKDNKQMEEPGGQQTREEELQLAPEGLEKQMEELNVDEDDLKSAGRSFNTFATNITTCTIPAFEKFFRNFSVDSELHTRMLAIHAAAQEYLKESNTPETSTSYFCSLLVSLEGVSDSEADTAATLALMARVMRRVAPAVLQARFGAVSSQLNDVLTKYQDSDNTTLITNALGSLSVVLRGQERAQWSYSSTLNLLDKLLTFTMHPKPKIRRAAQYNASAILKGSSFILEENTKQEEAMEQQQGKEEDSNKEENTKQGENQEKNMSGKEKTRNGHEHNPTILHPAAGHVADFCISQVHAATETNNLKTRLHLLVLLRQVIQTFPRKKVKSVCEMLLSLMQLGRSLTNTCAMQALYSLLASHPAPDILPLDTNVALVMALTGRVAGRHPGQAAMAIVPGKNDPQPASAWITVVTVALINLCKLSHEEGLVHITHWVQQLIPYWHSDHKDIHEKVYQSVEAVLHACKEECGQEYLSGVRGGQVETMMNGLVGALSLQYQPAWDQVFQTLGVALEVLGPPCPALACPCLATLCQLMANPELPHRGALERAIGSGVKALGPQALMEVVPLNVTGDITVDETSLWTLPLMTRYLGTDCGTPPSLCYFVDYFMPRAAHCHQLAETYTKQNPPSPLLARTYKQVEVQIWNSLPGWCRGAQDAQQALTRESFARVLCEHVRNRSDTRICIMEALRIMLSSPHSPPLLSSYAKNYIPALFNVYLSGAELAPETESVNQPSTGQRHAALATVKAFLGVIEVALVGRLMDQIMTRYKDSSTDPARCQALMDLARVFLPRLDHQQLDKIYSTALVALGEDTQSEDPGKGKGKDQTKRKGSHKEQKAAYRLLEELLTTNTPAAHNFMANKLDGLIITLASGISNAAPPARPPRLRCLNHILQQLPEDLDRTRHSSLLAQVVGECVMCCSPTSSKATRKAAFTLLAQVGVTIQRLEKCSAEDTVRSGLKLLLAGLVGSPALAASTLMAITALTYQYKDVMPQDALDQLMKETCSMLKCSSREIIGACLSFHKSCLVIFPPQLMSAHVETLVAAISGMQDDCQRKFRIKTRDIFDRLLRKFGADYVTALVPKGSVLEKRLRNLRKAAARKQRDRDSKKDTQDDQDEEFTSRALPASLEEILAEIDSDDDDDEEDDDNKEERGKKGRKGKGKTVEKGGGKKKKAKNTTWIKEDDEEIVDLLDASAGQAIMSGARRLGMGPGQSRGQLFEMDKDSGKLIITDDNTTTNQENIKRQRTVSEGSQDNTQDGSEGGSRAAGKMNKGDSKQLKKKKRFDYGTEFKSRKAGGDMTRKDKQAPFAYVQFNKERLNKRKKAKYDGQFSSLVRGAKRGLAGAKRGKGKITRKTGKRK